MVYLVDTFGILGSGQSPRFTVSEKRRRERGNTTHSQWEKLTRIRDTPVTCGHRTYCEETEGKRREWRGPRRAGLTRSGCSPRPKGQLLQTQNPARDMASPTPEASANQTHDLQFLLSTTHSQPLLSPSSPTSALHPPVHSPADVRRDGHRLRARQSGSCPSTWMLSLPPQDGQDLSLGTDCYDAMPPPPSPPSPPPPSPPPPPPVAWTLPDRGSLERRPLSGPASTVTISTVG